MMPTDFETLIDQGVAAQRAGDHEASLRYDQEAYWEAVRTDNVVGQGRALRDGSASHSKLGDIKLALHGAHESVHTLSSAGNERELAVSRVHLGRMMAHVAVRSELEDDLFDMTPDELRSNTAGASEQMIAGLRKLDGHDQYHKNHIIRLAMDYAINGRTLEALSTSLKSVPAVFSSEHRGNLTSNPNLSHRERLKHRGKLAVALGASAVVSVTSRFDMFRNWSLKQAERVFR